MREVFEFMSVALPWIATGLLLAVFFVRKARRKQDKNANDENGSGGMSIGLCFGVAISTALHINVGLGMMAGMVLGYFIGSITEKNRED